LKVLIIGGNGFIGSYLCTKLVDHEIGIVDPEWFGKPDITMIPSLYFKGKLQEFLDTSSIHHANPKARLDYWDSVIFLSGHSSVPLCNKDPLGAVDNSVSVFMKLVDKISPNQKLIYASSSCVYGQGDMVTEDVPVRPTDTLSYTKSFMDFIAANCGKKTYGLRLGSVSGWSPNFRKDLALNSMAIDALSTNTISVFNPENRRPITSLYSIYLVVKNILEKEITPGIYNVAGFNTSFIELAERIQNIVRNCFDIKASINVIDGPGTYNFTMDSSKIEKECGISLSKYTSIYDIVVDIEKHSPCKWINRDVT
jgi:nucleoside-diphosphate-sugar epimerase